MTRWRAALLLVPLMLATVACGDDAADTTDTTDTTATSAPTSAPTSSPTTTEVPVDTSTAVFPTAASDTRFDDPVAAATAFATDYVGFTDPVMGEFMQGDVRSGEVEVRPTADGPVTTVFVRQLGPDDSWWVLGSATANIELTTPAALDTISSPVVLEGNSTAFEATVLTQVREDDNPEPLGEGFVMGGSMGDMGPFEGTLEFSAPTAEYGAVMLFTESQENGNLWEATVLRVAFGS